MQNNSHLIIALILLGFVWFVGSGNSEAVANERIEQTTQYKSYFNNLERAYELGATGREHPNPRG